MRTRYLLVVILCASAFVAVIALIGKNAILAGTIPSSKTTSKAQNVQIQPTQVKTGLGSLDPSTVISTPSIETPLPDGPSLLQSRCTQCHELQWLQQVNKTRTEWDETVSQMKWFGVKISDAEKTVLLDYLAGPGQP